jgi:cytochrome bd-type quinol oxidase subunit 1
MRPFRDRTEGLLLAALVAVTLALAVATGLSVEATLAQAW